MNTEWPVLARASAGRSLLKTMMKTIRILAFVAIAIIAGCNEPDDAVTTSSADTTAVTTVVDSILPIEEEIRRFKAAIAGASAEQFENAAASRDDLVRGLIEAIEKNDSATIRRMMITPAEFVDLYYPTTAFTRPPYRQSPSLVWFQIVQNSEKGIGRAMQRYGGRPTHYSGYECDPEPTVQGENRLWGKCVVRWDPGEGVAGTLRLFGTIIERDGRYKFVSYANGL